MKSVFVFAAAATALIGAASPAAAAFTLQNDLGGDGFVTELAPGVFSLFGSNDDTDDNVTSYFTTADADGTISGQFRYLTFDEFGGAFDPAGYFINDQRFQLSDDFLFQNEFNIGTFSFDVAQGDTYGFYVATTDGAFGRGVLTIGAVPEPASWAMLIAGFGLTGAALRRRRVVAA